MTFYDISNLNTFHDLYFDTITIYDLESFSSSYHNDDLDEYTDYEECYNLEEYSYREEAKSSSLGLFYMDFTNTYSNNTINVCYRPMSIRRFWNPKITFYNMMALQYDTCDNIFKVPMFIIVSTIEEKNNAVYW